VFGGLDVVDEQRKGLVWDDYQQELIHAGVEKMEKGFTKYVQDRVKLWNE